MDMDISMDIHAKICGYGYGYGWEISYARQACYYYYYRDCMKLVSPTHNIMIIIVRQD